MPLIDTRVLKAQGITRGYIAMCLGWRLKKLAPGLYHPKSIPPSWATLLEAAHLRYPRGVFCLFTALDLHGLQLRPGLPLEIWMAIDRKARVKKRVRHHLAAYRRGKQGSAAATGRPPSRR
jgi:hypothetical protein